MLLYTLMYIDCNFFDKCLMRNLLSWNVSESAAFTVNSIMSSSTTSMISEKEKPKMLEQQTVSKIGNNTRLLSCLVVGFSCPSVAFHLSIFEDHVSAYMSLILLYTYMLNILWVQLSYHWIIRWWVQGSNHKLVIAEHQENIWRVKVEWTNQETSLICQQHLVQPKYGTPAQK